MIAATAFLALALSPNSIAVGQDSVFVIKADGSRGKVNGRITGATREGVSVDDKLVEAATIRKITIGREPALLNRAREQFESGRYLDCIESLGKLEKTPTEKLSVADIDFMKAYSNSQISLRGGNIAPEDAGRQMQEFLSNHPDSFHFYPAIDTYAQLIFAFGRVDLAAKEIEKLKPAQWVEYRLKGHFQHGRMLQILGNNGQASGNYDAILKETGTDNMTQSYKLLAKIEKAKLSGLGGDAEAMKTLQNIVANENAENQLLFSYLNNAIGALHEKSGNLKAAKMSYLKTQLLYGRVPEPHAEAIFRLAKIWPQLGDNVKANQARESLKSLYRNSYWAKNLVDN